MSTALVFGAGATAACGGPMTAQILPDAYQCFRENQNDELFGREDFFHDLGKFLQSEFHVDPFDPNVPPQAYPSLPLLLSLVDTALDRKQPIGFHFGFHVRSLAAESKGLG